MTTVDGDGGGLQAVDGLVAKSGVGGRRLRRVLAMLTDGPSTLDDLVRECAVPRRSVEELLRAADPDLDKRDGGFVIAADRVGDYRSRFGYARLRASELADPLAERLAGHADLVARLDADARSAPAARGALDHVAATGTTVVRRALWLDASFDLSGARLLCVGDHDLTSLALAAINPDLGITVVDVDEQLLEFIDSRAAQRGHNVQCLYADFRFGIPETVGGSADLVLTDPPYTPDGVQLFLGRGLQGLRDRVNSRLIMAYGFSPLHPALGLKVQRAVQDLDLAIEAILPAFNRYHGAQAIGSASDLYVCRPTSRTWQILDKRNARAAVNIYTHGSQSLEGLGAELDEAVAHAVIDAASGTDTQVLLAGDGWPGSVRGAREIGLDSLLGAGVPTSAARNRPVRLAVNLAADSGSWLLRVLLAANADRLAVLLPNNHPDLANETAQHRLIDLVAPKYTLRLRRTTPTSRHAIVEATTTTPGDNLRTLSRQLLTHAHGKVANVWREALIQHSADGPAGPLTKNAARTLIGDAVTRPDWLDRRLIDLPRHVISTVLSEVDGSAPM